MPASAATLLLDPVQYWSGLDRPTRVLYTSVAASVVLHALALSLQFRFPDQLRWKSANQPLEVVLVNAKTRDKPVRAEVLAQAQQDGGGDVAEKRRARSPLPATERQRPLRDLAEAQRRRQELEARQQQLLAQTQAARASIPVEAQRESAAHEAAAPSASGRDLAEQALAALRLQAQIDRRIQEYQKRPRKRFIGARAAEYRFAQYEEEWRAKIERLGTLHYPAEARGKLYGNLRLTVTIRPDGTVDSVELDRSSGLKVLDDAAFRIVRMAEPFAAFPPEVSKDTDLLVITRTWFFGQGDRIWTD